MPTYFARFSRFSALLGGLVLLSLAMLMTLSIIGGAIAKLGYSQWLQATSPLLAQIIQDTGIRTLRGLYELMKFGGAFAIFAFLPLATLKRSHAVVDSLAALLPKRANQLLITLWDCLFFLTLLLMTWRLFYGLERMISSNTISQELKIPEWWGYGLAFCQLLLTSLVAGALALQQIFALFRPQAKEHSHERL